MNIQKRKFTEKEKEQIRHLITVLNFSLINNCLVAVEKNSLKTFYIETVNKEVILSPTDDDAGGVVFDFNNENILDVDYQLIMGLIQHQNSINYPSNKHHNSINYPSNKHQFEVKKNKFLSPDGSNILFSKKNIRPRGSSQIEDVELKELSSYFEELILSKLNLNLSYRAVQSTLKLYDEYLLVLETGKHQSSKIYNLIERLKEQIEEVKEKKIYKMETLVNKKVKEKFTTAIVFVSLLTISLFSSYYFLNKNGLLNLNFYKEKIEMITHESTPILFSKSELDILIDNSGYKVWEYRRNLIYKNFANKKFTKVEAQKLVNQIASEGVSQATR